MGQNASTLLDQKFLKEIRDEYIFSQEIKHPCFGLIEIYKNNSSHKFVMKKTIFSRKEMDTENMM